ncbi:MAG: anti-sigma factor [Candidatus Omnitrophota bacterium]
MRCDKIQELLKTNYLDGRLNPRQKEDIKQHLEICPRCRKLEQELQAQRVLFKNIGQQEVPERVWHNIRETILAENLNPEPFATVGIFQRLKELIFTPRPVFALASAFAVIIFVVVITGISIHKQQGVINFNNEEIAADYGFNGDASDNIYDLGTNIEQYFL